jgi:hypothetical protein
VSELHYANNEVTFNGQKMTVEQFIGFVMESRCDERRAVIVNTQSNHGGAGQSTPPICISEWRGKSEQLF